MDTIGLTSVKNQLKSYTTTLDRWFVDFFPSASVSPSLWLFPLLGVYQVRAYRDTGVRRAHFVSVVCFGFVLSGSEGVAGITRGRFAAVIVIFFGVTRHYADKMLKALVSSGYIEIKEKVERGRGRPAVYYGWTEKGAAKWARVLMLFNKRMQERAALLRHMEEIGKPVRFTR